MTNIETKDQLENLIKSNKPTLVDFSAIWCGPCKFLEPVLHELETDFKEVSFVKVDVDAHKELAMQFQITTVPTVIVFKNGTPLNRFSGFRPKPTVAEFIKTNAK